MAKTKVTTPTVRKDFFSSKYLRLLYLIILSLLFFSNYNRIFDEKIDMNGDNITYYALGNSIADGKGFTNTIGYLESPHTHFPPGYPYFVAFVMKMGADSIKAIKIINGVLLYFSMILLFYVLAAMSRKDLIAFTATAFAVSQITILRFATIMMSEMLFLFFTLIVLLIIFRWKPELISRDNKKRWKNILILCLLAGSIFYLYLIRTMGLSFIIAVIVYYLYISFRRWVDFYKVKKRQPECAELIKEKKILWLRYALVFVVVLLSFSTSKLMWDARSRSVGLKQSNYIENFNRKQNGETMQTLSDWATRFGNNTKLYITKWIPSAIFSYQTNTDDKSSAGWWKGIMIIVLLCYGLYKLPKGGLLLFLYLGITMGVLLIWPEQYGGQRYMLSIIPFLIFLFIYGGYELLVWLAGKMKMLQQDKYRKFYAIVACLLFTIMAYPSYSKSINDAEAFAKFRDYTTANAAPPLAEFLDAIRWVKTNIQDTGRVSTRKPELFYIYSGGRKSTSFPYYATPEEIVDYFTTNHIRYVIIDRWFRHAYVTVMPAVQKYQDKFKILHQIGGAEPNTPPTYVLEFNPAWGYIGDMVDGKRQGQGVYTMQDGRTYSGAFANDMCNGYGVMTDAQGNVLAKGIWKDNALVKPE